MLAALLIFTACASSPWIEVGLGRTAFVPAAAGDPAPLVYGPQGGWHIDVAARFGGFRLEEHALRWEAADAETGAPVAFVTDARITPRSVLDEGSGWLRLGDRVVFDVAAPAEIDGRSVIVSGALDVGGAPLLGELVVVVVDAGP